MLLRILLAFILFQTSMARCPQGYAQGPNPGAKYNCYRIFPGGVWADAEQNCQNLGGHLASIEDVNKDDFLVDITPNFVWVGGSRNGSSANWTWSDGTEFLYTNWHEYYPWNETNCDCIALSPDSTWTNRFTCYAQFTYVCEVPEIDTSSAKCPVGYFEGTNELNPLNCYKAFSILPPLTWNESETICQYHGGHLASISDAFLNNLLTSWSFQTTFWIGGISPPYVAFQWDWGWSDGSLFWYSSWQTGNPHTWDPALQCVYNVEGSWLNDYCNNTNEVFFCEVPKI